MITEEKKKRGAKTIDGVWLINGSSAVFKILCKRANCDAQMIPGA